MINDEKYRNKNEPQADSARNSVPDVFARGGRPNCRRLQQGRKQFRESHRMLRCGISHPNLLMMAGHDR